MERVVGSQHTGRRLSTTRVSRYLLYFLLSTLFFLFSAQPPSPKTAPDWTVLRPGCRADGGLVQWSTVQVRQP